VKVLLRNPRREIEVEGAMQVSTLLSRLDINRESVIVIRSKTVVPGDAWLNRDDEIEIRPVISGGDFGPIHPARGLMPVGSDIVRSLWNPT